MIRKIIHSIVAIPVVYDLAQYVLGGRVVVPKFQKQCEQITFSDGWIVDYAGGTGRARTFFKQISKYLLLDIDMVKIKGFRKKYPNDLVCHADVTCPPITPESADLVMAQSLMHHLTDEQMNAMFDEIPRILKPGGMLLICEPLANSSRYWGRLLWRYDRGSFPKPLDSLLAKVQENHTIIHQETFTVLHDYLIVTATRND
ncbi:MAG: class I SAM-dependent methyltransferase [Flavobacteriales bacterium]|nr:class I SAM-dependent methyltransferase [Flavobacteriales bacterium]